MTNNADSIIACFIPARLKVCILDDLSFKCYSGKIKLNHMFLKGIKLTVIISIKKLIISIHPNSVFHAII